MVALFEASRRPLMPAAVLHRSPLCVLALAFALVAEQLRFYDFN